MKIVQGEFEMINSGSLYSPSLENIKFIISESPLLVIECRILQDNSKDKSINLEVIDNNTVAIIFKNPEGLGYGISKPVLVANYKGKELYVTFHISMKENKSSFLLEYSFYVKGK